MENECGVEYPGEGLGSCLSSTITVIWVSLMFYLKVYKIIHLKIFLRELVAHR